MDEDEELVDLACLEGQLTSNLAGDIDYLFNNGEGLNELELRVYTLALAGLAYVTATMGEGLQMPAGPPAEA